MAAGCILLAGVLSLLSSLDRQAPGAFLNLVLDHSSLIVKDLRRHSMAVPHSPTAALDRSWESATTRPRYAADLDSLSSASVTEVRDALTGYPQAHASYGMLERLEQVIRQYPWPTLMIGIGLGFLLARRMRA